MRLRYMGYAAAVGLLLIGLFDSPNGSPDEVVVATRPPARIEQKRAASVGKAASAPPRHGITPLVTRNALMSTQDLTATQGTAFSARTWVSPVVGPSLEDTGPPQLPFRYVGRQTVGGEVWVLLEQGSDLRIARESDRIADVYKVISIDESLVTFEYLPMHMTQTLAAK